jgi:hypothetical protein
VCGGWGKRKIQSVRSASIMLADYYNKEVTCKVLDDVMRARTTTKKHIVMRTGGSSFSKGRERVGQSKISNGR